MNQEIRVVRPRSYALDASLLVESIRQRLEVLFQQENNISGYLPSCIKELDNALGVCQDLLNAYQYEITEIDEDDEYEEEHYSMQVDRPVLHTPWEKPRNTLSTGIQATFHKHCLRSRSESPPTAPDEFSSPSMGTTSPPSGTDHIPSPWTNTSSKPLPSSTAFVNHAQGSQQEVDTLLFHLVIALQLCQVRVEEACSIFVSRQPNVRSTSTCSKLRTLALGSMFFAGTVFVLEARHNKGYNKKTKSCQSFKLFQSIDETDTKDRMNLLRTTGKVLSVTFCMYQIRTWWRKICVNARIADTVDTLNLWQQKWILCQCWSVAEHIYL